MWKIGLDVAADPALDVVDVGLGGPGGGDRPLHLGPVAPAGVDHRLHRRGVIGSVLSFHRRAACSPRSPAWSDRSISPRSS